MGMFRNLVLEFKEFAIKGNAIDLAVGVVIGAAFGGVVQSLVKDIVMPPLGMITGGVDFSDKVVHLKTIQLIPGETPKPPVDLRYGVFLNSIINFLIVAAAIFVVIKLMNMLHKKAEAEPDPPLTTDQKLLTEIRDLLKTKGTESPSRPSFPT
jgi:large conductance mechanosensitive channel